MTTPIERSKPRPTTAPPQTAETKAPDAPPAGATQPAPSKTPASGATEAPVTFTQARPEARPKASADLAVPAGLSRSERSREALPMDSAPASKQAAPADKSAYPVKPQAEEPLKKLNEDPRVKGNPEAQRQLGKMIDSDVFRKLDAKGQTQALELFKANLGNKDALARVPEAVQNLAAMKSEQGAHDVLTGLTKASPLTADTVNKTRDLIRSPEFAKLSAADQRLITEGLREAKCNPEYAKSLKGLIQDPKFKALKPEEQRAILERTRQFPDARAADLFKANLGDKDALARAHQACDSLGSVKSAEGKLQVLGGLAKGSPLSQDMLDKTKALLGSPKFAGLSEADQKLVTEGIQGAKADPKYTANLKKLIEDPKFASLKPDEQTAVLSQTKNYPDHRSVHNVQRMLQKDWFNGMDLGDKQRALKTVAWLSQHDKGDRKAIDNTLDKFLSPTAPYKLKFENYTPPKVGTIFASASGDTLSLNKNLLDADNKKVPEDGTRKFLVLHCVAHEVNHLVNGGDTPKPKYEYLEAEYRAWYVGYKAEHGKPPSNDEAMGRWAYLLNPDGAYGDSSKGALADPKEAAKIYAELSKITGMKVDASNVQSVLKSDPKTWPSGGSAPGPVPPGNLDNS